MTNYNALFDNDTMKAELVRLVKHFGKDEPVKSHIWVAIRHPGVKEGEWTFDLLDDFLTLCSSSKGSGATIYTLWSNNVNHHPLDPDALYVGNTAILNGTTLVNVADLILACVEDDTLYLKHESVIYSLITYPWRKVIESEPETLYLFQNALAELLSGDKQDRVDNERLTNEYHRVLTSLEKGERVPSHILLHITYDGNTGSNIWDKARLMTCLEGMGSSESSDLTTEWTDVPEHVTQPDKNGVYPINLSDFIWQCCQHKDIVYSHLALTVAMMIHYPFCNVILDDHKDWVPRTLERIKDIHLMTQRHTTH